MPKVMVIYKSRWGNTRRVAEAIIEGMNKVAGTETTLSEVKQVDPAQLAGFDAILIGSPNHAGTATWGISRFINRLGQFGLEGKLVAVFDTYFARDVGKAVRKMENRLREKAPSLEVASPGLSVRVDGMKGPITDGELPKCREFGSMISGRLKERVRARQ